MTEQNSADAMTTADVPDYNADQASPQRAAEQVDAAWPKPGDEGYVNPDGTPQAAAQLAANRQAARDRAAAGSVVHGAPAVERGGRPDATDIAAQRAEAYSGPSTRDRDKALTETIREGQAENPNAPVEPETQTAPRSPRRQGGASSRSTTTS